MSQRVVALMRSGNTTALRTLVESGVDLTSPLSSDGATPLHWAAFYNKVEAIELVLGLGASVNHAADNGATALHWAAGAGALEAVALLLKCGANVNVFDARGRSAADYARLNEHHAIDHLLLPLQATSVHFVPSVQ